MKRIFVVTGANKGIGYGIVKTLAHNVTNGVIYLTARDKSRGEAALQELKKELDGKSHSELRFHQLDITDKKSVEEFKAYLRKEHDGFDVLVNNAGFAFKHNATEAAVVQARVTIGVNYEGTKQVCDALFPLIRNGGRVVNVASQMGLMKRDRYSEEIIKKMTNPNLTVQGIEEFCNDYIKAAEENKRKERGYPESAYCVSKTALAALTFIQAKEMKARDIIVNACCPGYVNTDMTSHKGSLTIEEGADTPAYLATLEDKEPCGKFVYLRKVIDFVC